MLAPDEARRLPGSIDLETPADSRNWLLIGLTVYSFARVDAALAICIYGGTNQDRTVQFPNTYTVINVARVDASSDGLVTKPRTLQ